MEKYMEDGEEVKIYKWKDVSDLKERRQNNIQILVNATSIYSMMTRRVLRGLGLMILGFWRVW